MPDIQFTLPLPIDLGKNKVLYLNSCRSSAWDRVSKLPLCEAREWPTQEKVRCEILVYTKGESLKDKAILYEMVDHIGDVLWNKKKNAPLVLIQELVAADKDIIEVKITRRKLISEKGPGKHYQY